MSNEPQTILAKPPTRENVTEVAYAVKRWWDVPGQIYCPVICYKVVDGRIILSREAEHPDNPETKPLLDIHPSPNNRMSEYRSTIYAALRSRGVV